MDARVVLIIGSWNSTCGACGLEALPEDLAHTSPAGYGLRPGCGAVFTHVRAVYQGSEERVKEMRPDLVFLDPMQYLDV